MLTLLTCIDGSIVGDCIGLNLAGLSPERAELLQPQAAYRGAKIPPSYIRVGGSF